MPYQTILYDRKDKIATITLNRPEKLNTIRAPMPDEVEQAVIEANADPEVRVIVLKGAGKSFCAGYDFSGAGRPREAGLPGGGQWDPGMDMVMMTSPFTGPTPKFMSLWYSHKPVIAQVHGWCVGGGTDMVLCADIIIATEDAKFGIPYARAWGCALSGMWIYRLNLSWAKRLMLTGDEIDAGTAERIGLINKAVPADKLEDEVQYLSQRLAKIPVTQLAAMKLVINQTYENMGLHSTQLLGLILDGSMRHTPEGLDFVKTAYEKGAGVAAEERDRPFGDYRGRRWADQPGGP